ncbi:hypothetical protein [Kitasatospora camelliae]|uniref:Uncharacterized protein n=1 Tax=Kitasatospora camelliae TaxID=3156397 RepID=A0AAU8KA74_9ACTN
MDDATAPSPAEQVRLDLDTLRLRMDPDQFRVLGTLLNGALTSLSGPAREGRVDLSDEDEVLLTREVKNELLTILAIMATGKMDHHIVDLGNGATTVMDAGAANDPDAVQRARDRVERHRAEQEHTESVLRGIEEASQD